MCNVYMRTEVNLQQHCFPPLNRNIYVDFYIDDERDRETQCERERDIKTTVRERQYFDEDGDIQYSIPFIRTQIRDTLHNIIVII